MELNYYTDEAFCHAMSHAVTRILEDLRP